MNEKRDRDSVFWSLIAQARKHVNQAGQHQRKLEDLERRQRDADEAVERAEREHEAARKKWLRLWWGNLVGQAQAALRFSKKQSERASKKRKPRGRSPKTELRLHGLRCVLRDNPGIESKQLCDRLDADGHLTFDYDDVELRLSGDRKDLVIRDLNTDITVKTPISSLRKYLADARNT